MRVIAKRSTTALKCTAVFVLIYTISKYVDFSFLQDGFLKDFVGALPIISGICVVIFGIVSALYALVPRTVIECDKTGFYINRRFAEPIILRYNYLFSINGIPDVKRLYGDKLSGTLRLETPDGFIVIRGVACVKKVQFEIKDILNKKHKELIRQLEEGAKKQHQQRKR